jgi:hypothetical protein
MTAKELDTMVNAMRSKYHKVNTRVDVTNEIAHLYKGLEAIGRYEIANKILDLCMEIDSIDTDEIVRIGTFNKR